MLVGMAPHSIVHPFVHSCPLNIGISLQKQAKRRTIMHTTVCNLVTVKSTVDISQNFVAFSECMNFIYNMTLGVVSRMSRSTCLMCTTLFCYHILLHSVSCLSCLVQQVAIELGNIYGTHCAVYSPTTSGFQFRTCCN